MTYDEVVAILGEGPFIIAGGVWHTWENDSGDEIDIEVEDDKRVKTKRFEEWPDDRPAFEKLMDQLPWRERPVRHRTRFIY
jgi:hypothetical protein